MDKAGDVILCDNKAKNAVIAIVRFFNILKPEGFARLPRRQKSIRQQSQPANLKAIKAVMCDFKCETFKTASGGVLCLLPILKKYGIDNIIANSSYPETKSIDRSSSILSFLALKANNARRYPADDLANVAKRARIKWGKH